MVHPNVELAERLAGKAPSVGSKAIPKDPRKDKYIKAAEIKLPDYLPQPVGWRLLIVPYVPPKKIGSIILTDSSQDVNKDIVMTGMVLDMGLDAYKGTDARGNPRFIEPWCAVGDWVMFAKWAGSRIQIEDTRFRLLNDDEIFAVVSDPSNILRA